MSFLKEGLNGFSFRKAIDFVGFSALCGDVDFVDFSTMCVSPFQAKKSWNRKGFGHRIMRHHATMSRLLRGMEYSVCWVDNISHADAPWFDVFVARFCYTSCVSHMCFLLQICAGMCLYSFECC